MRSIHSKLLAILVLAGCARPAAASELDDVSVFIGLDPWSVFGIDHRYHRHYDRYWPRYGYHFYGDPRGYRPHYYPRGYWAVPRYYGHYRHPGYRHRGYDRWDDHRWRDRHWRDRHWRDRHWRDRDWRDRHWRDRHWRDDDRHDRGGRHRRDD
jgi:hypothetical protein